MQNLAYLASDESGCASQYAEEAADHSAQHAYCDNNQQDGQRKGHQYLEHHTEGFKAKGDHGDEGHWGRGEA